MVTTTINLDAATADALRRRAARHKRSIEEEIESFLPLDDFSQAEASLEHQIVSTTWDSFFSASQGVSDDFLSERASQHQSEREPF